MKLSNSPRMRRKWCPSLRHLVLTFWVAKVSAYGRWNGQLYAVSERLKDIGDATRRRTILLLLSCLIQRVVNE